MELSPATEAAFLAIDYLVWAAFAAEYAIKLYLAPNRRQFVAHHVPDLIIALVPILRPLRVLRSVRLLRLLRLAAIVLEFERGNPDANIDSFPDPLWWAVTTITTVGYPASPCSA
jgi:voltage-gated potassium channel